MPLIIKKEIASGTQLGIWKIEEDAGWFRSQLILDQKENQLIDSIKNPQRKLHWLSSRVLLRTLMNTEDFIHLESDANGKPVIHNFNVQLSLSHSADLSALLLSNKFQVGIDIEKMEYKILRLQQKFLREDELAFVTDHERVEKLYAMWCAKEAMYKFYGKKQLDFRQHLFIKPFEYHASGELSGMIRKGDYSCELKVQYEKLGIYMMAYVIGAIR